MNVLLLRRGYAFDVATPAFEALVLQAVCSVAAARRPSGVRLLFLHFLAQVFMHLYEHLVRRVPMFEACDEGFIKALVQLLKPQVLMPRTKYSNSTAAIDPSDAERLVLFCHPLPRGVTAQ